MQINSKIFGVAVAVTAGFLWSFFSLGSFLLDILVITLLTETNVQDLSSLGWANYANKYLALLVIITLAAGTLGWMIAEIYNDLTGMFRLKLK